MATDWAGLLGAAANIYAGLNTGSKNQTAAQNYGNFTQFNPYNVGIGNQSVAFQGNNAIGSLSPEYQAIQKQLSGGAGGLLGGMGDMFANGGMNQYLTGAMGQYDQSAPGNTLGGVRAGPTSQISTNMGDQFNATSQGFLGGLGGFDPNQVAQSYTNNLRQQAQPGNQRAAEGLAQRLFNTGRLGTTGGQGMYGELVNQQNQQDLQFQLAGQQYGGQEQNRLAGLAQGFGQLGTGINSQYAQLNDQFLGTGFNRNMALAGAQFDQGNMRAQQRFQNAMSLFGAGQQNQQGSLQNALGMLQGAQGLDQGLLQAIGLGGNLGAARSNSNQSAYAPGLEATVAKNNTGGAALINGLGGILDSGILDQIGGWLGMGGNGGGVSPDQALDYSLQPVKGGNFSSAGGEAAQSGGGFLSGLPPDTSGIGYMTPSVTSQWGGVPDTSGIGYMTPSVSKQGEIPPTAASGVNWQGALNTAGQALGVYNGIKQGDAAGYASAAGNAASMVGYDLPFLGYADAVSKAAKGDVPAAAVSAISTYMPAAGVMFAVADALNKKGDIKSGATQALVDGMVKDGVVKHVNSGKVNQYQLPDGGLLRAGNKARAASEALRKGDMEGYKKAYQEWIADAFYPGQGRSSQEWIKNH